MTLITAPPLADAGKEGRQFTGRSYGNGANVQSVRAGALEARGGQRDWENYITYASTFTQSIQFVMDPKIRAWDNGTTHEGIKRS